MLNLLVVTAVCLLLWRLWQAELHSAEIQAVASVTQLQQSTSATLAKVEVSVKYAVVQAQAQLATQGLASASFWSVMDAARTSGPELQRMGVFDAAGHLLCSPKDTPCRGYEIGDRDYFAALRTRPESPPLVYGPIVARPNNELSLLVVQAFGTPDKPFSGVIMAVVPVSRLQPLVAAAKVGAKGIAGLRTESLQLLTRAIDAPAAAASGLDQGVSDVLHRHIAKSPNAGSYRNVQAVDQVDRMSAYQKLPAYPLYALVGLAVDDVTDAWQSTAAWAGGLVLLLIAASLAIERLAQANLLRQAQAQALYDEAPCGYHSLDAQGRFLGLNATELRWLGCAREDVIGKLGPADFFTDEGRRTFETTYPVFQHTGRVDHQEFDLTSRGGETRRVAVSARVVTDASGRFLSTHSVMHDITALHAARVELAARADQQEAMIDNNLVGMLKVRAGIITWTNREMDRIFGYDEGDWIGMPIARLFDDEAYYRQTAARIGILTYRVGLFREDQGLVRKDGSRVWVDVSTLKIDPTGAESFTIVKDITDRKNAETEHLRAIELESQNAALRESGRLKDEFVSNLSHELRTPLNAIIGFARLLGANKSVADVPKAAHHVRLIADSGQHLLGLIETMLDFAKTASQKMQFAPVAVHVQVALNEAAEMLGPKRLAAGVEMTVSVEPGLDHVINDPLRLRQMLINLAANAIKFSKPGGTVGLSARALDADRWCIDVSDQGIGIAAEDLPRLFAPFVQLSAGSTKVYPGTGLGLALVRSIARAQGGDVVVRSELGVGSVFTLTLPRSLAGTEVRLPASAS